MSDTVGRTHHAPGTTPTSSWTVMEARLVTAKVQDLLDRAAAELGRLARADDLPPDIAAAVTDTLHSVEVGRRNMGAARQTLRRPPAAVRPDTGPTTVTLLRREATA